MKYRPPYRALASRRHARLAGALVFDRNALGFRLRGAPRTDAPAPPLDLFTRQALALREAGNARG